MNYIAAMNIRRIVPNIPSANMEESKKFYRDFLGLNLVMDMEWILTFASPSNPTAQISVVKNDKPPIPDNDISISIETEKIGDLYRQAISNDYKIRYPITNEPWGVRRFFVQDPNCVIINIMCHIPQ